MAVEDVGGDEATEEQALRAETRATTLQASAGVAIGLALTGAAFLVDPTKVSDRYWRLAPTIVFAALRACGLSGYRTDSEFSIERYLRDVLSSPIMINNDRILANLATSALLTPIPGSVRD